jgi:RHS repeat-associated protein
MGTHWQTLFARIVCGALASVATLSLTGAALAERPAPLGPQTLKVPSGPASLKGLGESFSENVSTGTGSYSIPIELPAGFITPRVSLSYAGGAGCSELGVGFRLPLLQVYRLSDKGAPKYDETDRFAISGPEYNDELVLVNAAQRLYRLKNEGAFVLLQRDATNDRWLVLQPGGGKSTLGETAASRSQAAGKTTRWFVESTTDPFAHVVRYRYVKDQGRVYWKGLDYQQESAIAYRNRVEFEYESRPDVTRDYRYGDLEQTNNRLKSIDVWQGDRRLRRYTITYDPSALFSVVRQVDMEGEGGLKLPSVKLDYLAPSRQSGRFVKMEGFRSLAGLDVGHMTLEDVNADGLPDLLNGDASNYSYSENIDGVKFSDTPTSLGVSGSPDRALDAPGVVLADVDGDGYRDVWYPVGDGRFRFFTGGRVDHGRFLGFGIAQVMNGNGVVSDVTRPEIRLTDLNSDGRTDLLYQRLGIGDLWVENRPVTGFVQQNIPALPSGVRFDDPNVELIDFNGDGPLDLVLKEFDTSKHNLRIWYGLGSGRFADTSAVFSAPAASRKEVFLTDVNRDGRTDLVRVSGSWVGYYLNDGGSGYVTQHGDFRGMPETSRTRRIFLADMDGNGTSDVVWLTVEGGLSYLDLMGEPNVGLLSRVDNGMGMVTEIAYRSSTEFMVAAKLQQVPWATPLPHPVSVISEVSVRDSLEALGVPGWQRSTTYDYRDGYYDGREREFRGFAKVTRSEWGNDDQEGRVSELRMHVGRNLVTGADEEILKGKAWLQIVRTDSGALLSSEEAKWEQRWLCQEDLGAGAAQVLPTCTGIVDKAARKDDLVAFAVQSAVLRGAWERQSTPRYSATRSTYDLWGHTTKVEAFGEVTLAAGHVLGDDWNVASLTTGTGNDERAQETDYIHRFDPSAGVWRLGLIREQRVKNGVGAGVSKTRSYYDGAALVGLPLGQAAQGLMTRRESWLAEEARWVTTSRSGYSSDGTVVLTVDSANNQTTIGYDPQAPLFAVEERRRLSSTREAVFTATYDRGYGVITSLRDANGRTSNFRFDGLGRLTQVEDPTATQAAPTLSYSYQFGTSSNPLSKVTTRQLTESGKPYRTTIEYRDGLGRPRLAKLAAENGTFVGSGYRILSRSGQAIQTYSPFFSTNDQFEAPPAGTPYATTDYDAVGRRTLERGPATADVSFTVRATEYRPFETREYSERDSSEGTFSYPTISRVDGLGRKVEVEKSNQSSTGTTISRWTLGYDERGNLTSFKDVAGWTRTYQYDSLDRLKSVADPNLGAVQYTYDDDGHLLSRVDQAGQEEVNVYAAAGRLSRRTLQSRPATGPVEIQADYLFHYDDAQTGGPLTAANLVGRVSWIESPTGISHYSYDDRGNLVEEGEVLWDGISPLSAQQRTTHRRQHRVNAAGEQIGFSVIGGVSVDLGLNARGLVDRLTAGLNGESKQLVQRAAYDARGSLTSRGFGNTIAECRRYDDKEQVTDLLVGTSVPAACEAAQFDAGNSGSLHLKYGWQRDGLLDHIQDLGLARPAQERLDAAYTYDRLSQLTEVTNAQGFSSYAYDKLQNLVSRKRGSTPANAVSEALSYGENGAGPNAVTHVGSAALAYNNVGQLKQYNGFDLTFDAAGRLIRAQRPSGKRIDYYYDSQDARRLVVVTESGGKKHIFRYPFEGVEERDGVAITRVTLGAADVEIRKLSGLELDATLLDELVAYVNAPAGKPKPLPQEWLDLDGDGDGFDAGDLAEAQAAYWAGRLAGTPRNEWRYIHHDHLGSSALTTDSAGVEVSARRYDPYGNLAVRRGVQPSHGFAGAEVEPDAELGLVRMGARYYAPALGRWATPDRSIAEVPARMAQLPLESNLYSYARQNPIMFVDPTGMEGEDAPVVFQPEGGHHFVPKEVTAGLVGAGKVSPEAAAVFQKNVTGWGEGVEPHQWSVAHKEYNQAVTAEFDKFFPERTAPITAAQAEAFVAHVKVTPVTAIRSFLDPHIKVVQMIRAGETKAVINKFWTPIRSGFTLRGGWIRGVGAIAGRVYNVLNVIQIIQEYRYMKKMEAAGYEQINVDVDGNPTRNFTMFYKWVPKGSTETCLDCA